MEYAIETFSLTKTFSDWWGRNKVFAVDNLDLKVKYNEVYGLLGPNGSGKTTTIKMMLGLLNPTKGKTVVLSGDSRDTKINVRIGFLPEESYLYKYLNARETLDFYGRLFGLPSEIRKSRIEDLLDMVGLKAVANRAVGTYSKGMARRIGLAQALINDPELLILDEPTTGLDPIGTRQIKDLIIQLAKRGKTILLCSHLLSDVEDVCDRIAIMYGGKIQIEGSVRDLLQQTGKTQITTEQLDSGTLKKIEDIIKASSRDLEVSCPMDKLESFFIRIVRQAQNENVPTSGAVSTTQIGGFLRSETISQELLEKLVTAKVSDSASAETARPVSEKSSDAKKVKTDEALLKGLSSNDADIQTKPVTKQMDRPQPTKTEQVNTDILRQLVSGNDNAEKSGDGVKKDE